MSQARLSNQPLYSKSESKYNQKKYNIKLYRDLTGNFKIPDDLGYWFLCHWQHDEIFSCETNQILSDGLASKNQIFGVDYSQEIINFNNKEHPDSNWYSGSWLDVIREKYKIFKPAFVHLDCTCTVVTGHRILIDTMDRCSPQDQPIFIASNFGLEDGRSSRRFDPRELVKKVYSNLRWSNKWRVLDGYDGYRTNRVDMATIYFWKE